MKSQTSSDRTGSANDPRVPGHVKVKCAAMSPAGGRGERRSRHAGSGSWSAESLAAGKFSGTIGSGTGRSWSRRDDSDRSRPGSPCPRARRRRARAGSAPAGDLTAEQDLECDEFVARRLERDPSVGRVPEMVGGQVVLGFGGIKSPVDGMDLVELVDDRDLDSRRLAAAGRHALRRSADDRCSTWAGAGGPGRGSRPRIDGRRCRPELPAPSTA